MDGVTLYQAELQGRWTAQLAGDLLAQTDWHKRGLYPDFAIHLPDTAPRDIYLQVRNFKQLAVPIRIASAPQRESQRQLEVLGLMLGVLLSLAALSMLRYLEHRQSIDGWAALFGLLIAATIAQITGVLNAFFWGVLPELGNYASHTMPVLAVGSTLLFVRHIFVLHVHFHRFDRFLSSVGWGTIASVLALR